MSFCLWSTEKIEKEKCEIDNVFISNYMIEAPELAVKVYLYGLFLIQNGRTENTLEDFAEKFSVDTTTIIDSFCYWQEKGLVQVLSTEPVEVKYIPLKNSYCANKKFSSSKYADFNLNLQSLFDRMITPNEFVEFYSIIESFHITKEAILLIAKYCTEKKGRNVGYNYILTVAKNWINEGILTVEDVAEKIENYNLQTEDLKKVLSALKLNRMASMEEFDLYVKWTEKMGVDCKVICFVAKSLKEKGKCDFSKLDQKICKYYSMGLTSELEIKQFEELLDDRYDIAKTICKNLGLYYENLEPVIDNYIVRWQEIGYDKEVLSLISTFCFKKNIRTLEGMSNVLEKLHEKGIISKDALLAYFDSLIEIDKQIATLLNIIGIERQVTNFDRDNFKVWTEKWGLSSNLIEFGGSLVSKKFGSFTLLNRLLSYWHDLNIRDNEQAKSNIPKFVLDCQGKKTDTKNNSAKIEKHDFSQQQLNALFDSLDEVEI